MRIVETKARMRHFRNVKKYIREFVESNVRTAEVKDWEPEYDGDYESAYNSLYQSARASKRYSKIVRVTRWNGHIYLERIDQGGGAE